MTKDAIAAIIGLARRVPQIGKPDATPYRKRRVLSLLGEDVTLPPAYEVTNVAPSFPVQSFDVVMADGVRSFGFAVMVYHEFLNRDGILIASETVAGRANAVRCLCGVGFEYVEVRRVHEFWPLGPLLVVAS